MSADQNTSLKLEACKEKIIEEWEKRVRRSTLSNSQMSPAELRNSLPEVLSVMVNMLSEPDPKNVLFAKEKVLAIGHGKMRAQEPHYSLDQVIKEYHILHQVILEVLEGDGQRITSTESELILDLITLSIRNAATEFKAVQDQEKEEVHEKLRQANSALQNTLAQTSSEARLKHQLLNTIFERVEDYALFTLDSEGNVTSWSEGCRKIKQYLDEEIIGKHYSILYPPEGRIRKEPEKHLEIAVSQGRFRGEGQRMRKNGDLFLADVFITPMFESTNLVGFFKIVTDVTERNKLMQEMDLTRTQIETMKLESQLRERFVNMLTHDLRNPLAAALMNAELIARQTCNIEKHHALAERSAHHIKRVDEMISNLLDTSRIKEGKPFPLQLAEFDLAKLVTEVCEELGTIMGDRFRADMPSSVFGFWDARGLKRVLENLATNAVKYGDQNRKVTILLNEAEDRVIFKVHNFGLPISMQEQASLFEIFQRAESAQHGENKGWGLGLTLVRGIAEAHGGIVKVRSLPDEGTTFTVDLPRDARSKMPKQ
jgi:PAS domain S-box-containing protein